MGYKLKGDVKDYFNALTEQDIKEAFEAYGFEVVESPDGLHDTSTAFHWKEPAPETEEIVVKG